MRPSQGRLVSGVMSAGHLTRENTPNFSQWLAALWLTALELTVPVPSLARINSILDRLRDRGEFAYVASRSADIALK
jgi:hypothetical protein